MVAIVGNALRILNSIHPGMKGTHIVLLRDSSFGLLLLACQWFKEIASNGDCLGKIFL